MAVLRRLPPTQQRPVLIGLSKGLYGWGGGGEYIMLLNVLLLESGGPYVKYTLPPPPSMQPFSSVLEFLNNIWGLGTKKE